MRETKGITLISLIITIIVMLILIAVTVNVLIESGIIGSAKNAANKTQTAYEDEATLDRITIGGVEYDSLQAFEQQRCSHTYGNWEVTTAATCAAEGTETRTCTQCGKAETRSTSKAAHTYVDGACSVCGAIPVTASTIANTTTKSDYYGDYVTGITLNNGDTETEWRIFYADTNNIYLIAAHYINVQSYISSDLVSYQNTKYEVEFTKTLRLPAYDGGGTETEIFGEGKVGNTLLSTYLNHLSTNNLTKDYDNMKATAFMLDTTAWNGYTDSNQETKYIDYAIGGPTIEMFKDSYNDCQGTVGMYTPVGNYGYYFGDSPTTTTTHTSIGTANNLYVNDTTTTKASGYWLASPSNSRSTNLWYVLCNGNVSYEYYTSGLNGLRPVIRLNANAKLTSSGTDTYTVGY